MIERTTDDGVRLRAVPEDDQGFARLYTLRAQKGSRVLVRPHLSAADLAAFDFETEWNRGLTPTTKGCTIKP